MLADFHLRSLHCLPTLDCSVDVDDIATNSCEMGNNWFDVFSSAIAPPTMRLRRNLGALVGVYMFPYCLVNCVIEAGHVKLIYLFFHFETLCVAVFEKKNIKRA